MAFLQFGKVLLHRAAAGKIRPHLALHACNDTLQVNDFREIGGRNADGFLQAFLEKV